MISWSAVASTGAVVTSVAVAEDSALASVYPVGSADTSTVAPFAVPSYVKVPPVVVTTISVSFSVTVSFPIVSDTIL